MFNKKKLITVCCSTLILATGYIYAADSATEVSASTDMDLTTTSSDAVAVNGETSTTVGLTGTDADATEGDVIGADDTAEAVDAEFAKTSGANGITSVTRNLARKPDNAGLQNALEHLEANRERHEQHDLDRAGDIDRIEMEHPEELDHDSIVARPDPMERVAKMERPEKVEKVERVERVEKVEKAERPERVERPESAGRE